MNIAVILAGGSGTRIGADIPKQFLKINGKPILVYTIEAFQNNTSIDAIEIVCHKNWVEYVGDLIKEHKLTKVKWVVEGGSTFDESMVNGVFSLKGKISDDDIVVVSFGVSPMTTNEEIDDSIRVASIHGNGISAAPMDLLLCEINSNNNSSNCFLDREKIRGFSNPWSFKFGDLCNTYLEAMEKGILGRIEPHITSIYLALGKTLWLSKSNRQDIKITFKEDLDIFEAYLLLKEKREREGKQK